RTSAALAIILLAERYGVRPRTEPLPCDRSTEATDADAILLIGDRAFQTPSEPFAETWDLGDEWSRWTGLPFVFALWAARPEAPFEELSRLLQQSRDQGTERLPQIARREASALGIPLSVATEYLTENLHYRLGNSEREGLSVFRNLAARHGLIPKGVDLVFAESLA
ncbi:MAG: hypothetical protein GXP27_00735, partial [Planctomycetes bacterium]|nr:hypothetical protein [Planctomycetota bacterium]